MFTVLLTFVGLLVFISSLFGPGFKTGYLRLLMFAGTGVVLDVIIYTIFGAVYLFFA